MPCWISSSFIILYYLLILKSCWRGPNGDWWAPCFLYKANEPSKNGDNLISYFVLWRGSSEDNAFWNHTCRIIIAFTVKASDVNKSIYPWKGWLSDPGIDGLRVMPGLQPDQGSMGSNSTGIILWWNYNEILNYSAGTFNQSYYSMGSFCVSVCQVNSPSGTQRFVETLQSLDAYCECLSDMRLWERTSKLDAWILI